MDELHAAAICRALGDANRLSILRLLSEGELCACELLRRFDITQPTLSHHMKILCGCGLVNCRRDGKWCHYSLNCETLQAFQDFIGGVSCCRGQKEAGV